VAERLTQSGPVIKSCRPLEVSRSRIPSPPTTTAPISPHRIYGTATYRGQIFTEPKMGWRLSFKNIFRVPFCLLHIDSVKNKVVCNALVALDTHMRKRFLAHILPCTISIDEETNLTTYPSENILMLN
jgi:hypothetical protein